MKQSNGIKIAIIFVVAAGLAIGPIFYSQKVGASKDYELNAVGKGTISCPDGTKIKNARISLFVFNGGKGNFAEWNVDQKGHGSSGGIITQDSISSSNYKLKGIEAFDNMCDSKVPAKTSLSGNCGASVKVDLKTTNGEKGAFNVHATCSAVQ